MATGSDGAAMRYSTYLEQFTALAGTAEVGEFVKHNGRLVKKLAAEEYEAMFEEFRAMANQYVESMEHGDTVNDQVVHLIRQRATELFIESPV